MSRSIILSIFLILSGAILSCGELDYKNLQSAYATSVTLITPMNDTVSSYGLSTYSGRQVQAEDVSSTSSLVGKSIDTITIKLQRTGLPSGTVQVGVFNSDLSVKQLFGTINPSSVATSYTQYSFSLTTPQIYQIQSGDRIGIKFNGGDASDIIAIMTDQVNSFDGTNSYLTYYTTSWQSLTASDLYMILELHESVSGPTVSVLPLGGTYNSTKSIALTASAPSTIYYTTDGSTPTTSSPSGPSPAALPVSTNSTLKFFAKDSLGNSGPTGSATYTIIFPPTVSASPPAGTYNATQSVTLAASRTPSTIYYTTDGSTPTTSSPSGPSPAALPVSTNSTLKFFAKDSLGNSSPTGSATYTIIFPSILVRMNDTTSSYGLSTDSGRQIQAEYLSSTSSLVGKSIDTITVQLQKTGLPSGTIQVGVFNSDRSVKQLFGTVDAGSVGTVSYAQYSLSLPSPQTYQIQSGDRIGIKFTGGDASNYITIMTDQNNSFDGTNSYLEYYTTTWQSYQNVDLSMVLQLYLYGPTVTASPPAGVYNSSQLVTLAALRTPSTIYYTTDGSTPTTSSPYGPSPIALTVGTNSTLKSFTKDSYGHLGSISSQTYVIKYKTVDKLGITILNPTASGGREWYNNWNNGVPRSLISGVFDPYDSQFKARGVGTVSINGHGIAMLSGSEPRMYVFDPSFSKLWKNVEVTIYGKRVSETQLVSWQGLEAGARSGSHDDATYPNVCTDSAGYPNSAYNGRLTYDGRADYEKEVLYHRGDAVSNDGSGTSPTTQPAFSNFGTPIDSTSGLHTMPKNTWIGLKFIVKSINNDSSAKMETWMDTTNGTNGGTWVKLDEYVDSGGWKATSFYSPYSPTNWPCPNVPLNYIIQHAMPYVFIRADYVTEIDYKDFSIREINPLP